MELIDKILEQNLPVNFTHSNSGYEIRSGKFSATISDTNEALKLAHLSPYANKLIFGKNILEEIVALEVKGDKVVCMLLNGSVVVKPMVYWLMSNKKFDPKCKELEGTNHYKYIKYYTKGNHKYFDIKKLQDRGIDYYKANDAKEEAMLHYGFTMFKGLKISQVPVLSFDIESSGLKQNSDSKVFLITNTFRDSKGAITRKHFRLDHYEDDDVRMIQAWCEWVQEVDPKVLTGHNIFGYDIPYINYCYSSRNGDTRCLPLGLNGEPIKFNKNSSSFRVDGGNAWDYHRVHCYGRSVVDGVFLAVRYDIGRKYKSWGLKQIAEQEGFISYNRQFYDASTIYKNWYIPEEREKIVAYGIDDSDDSLKIYDLMAPSLFYSTQAIAKPYQTIGYSASGAQLNSILVRAYLQDNHSIPKASEQRNYGGGISFGIPGIHENVLKIDVKSMYPSIIRSYNLYSKHKDPKRYYVLMVDYFTEQRFKNKELFKTTKDNYYDDLQASGKIFINSAYGLKGTAGLNFNDFDIADKITTLGREIIRKTILWATNKPLENWTSNES